VRVGLLASAVAELRSPQIAWISQERPIVGSLQAF
jgi:hypothetical protein